MKNICEWDNCKEKGDYKAPIEKDNSKNYRWLCKEHVKLFNKSWDYFDGMNQGEIEDFLKSDMTWHRPTQQFGSSENFLIFYGTMREMINLTFSSKKKMFIN